MKKTVLLNSRTAKASGYRALTLGYRLPQEQHMLDHVIADLRCGKIGHCLVKSHDGIAVWRAGGACIQGGFAAHLTPALSPARRGRKCLANTAFKKGNRS